MPGDSPALLGDQHADKKVNSKTVQAFNGSSCKAHKAQQINTDNADVTDAR